MKSLSVITNVQIERAAAFPVKFADNPVRAISLDTIQRRNAILDAVFYDVDAVTEEETPDLAFWLAREGAVILVPPTGSGRLKVFLSAEDFLKEASRAAALAIAGVGSSALGAAAFARNVADAIDGPVAAVVSGYGIADVLTEALGGFFWFGALNSVRHAFEPLDAITKMFSRSENAKNDSWTRTSKDTETVIALLQDKRFSPGLLVGHSKGNLVLSEALYALAKEQPRVAQLVSTQSRIVTISAKIGMPSVFNNVIDVMGEWDWFGALNSRPDIRADLVVPHAWHSTNPHFPMGMGIDVTRYLSDAMTMFETETPPARTARLSLVLDAPQRAAAAIRQNSSA
ncbi:hypothetical protein SAMCCGM7_pB0096 (plasmid) [Sinorhizobium americanum CCGM7]|uniref:hypothetical protein n=1 Tax=Sinorhizobium americanum TaxID=194963 RepID=UPI0004DAB499|nr:hypothetical protein [Sinorhizobium americanum]APG86812.1 hypothetical protein SAMCCGM7_pB0096 [Sinorhizobium americanum CCGM7]